MAEIVICKKRTSRIKELTARIGRGNDLDEANNMAGRILKNMAMSIEQQEKEWQVRLTSLLKKPLPFDTANPFKKSLYLEMMPYCDLRHNLTHPLQIGDVLSVAKSDKPQVNIFL
jgi:hypothetical protein